MKNRKTKIIFFDILTVILLMIQLQSLVVYFVHSLSYSHDLTWTDYLSIYSLYGISYTIYHSSFIYIYIDFIYHIFLEYLCNNSEDKRYMEKRTDPWNLSMVYCDKYLFCSMEDY